MPFKMLSVKNLVVTRSSWFTLNVHDFSIEEGNVSGLVGNNGAGKTTFLQAILDLQECTFDKLCLFDLTWQKNSMDIKRKLGVYLDETYLIDYMAINDYFNFLQHIYKTDPESFKKTRDVLIELLQLDIKQKQLISALSAGNKVKTGLIGSLLHNPQLVIWDEPFANLDPYARTKLIEIILNFKKNNNTTFIISSHNIDELYTYSDHFLCLTKGNVVASDIKQKLTKEAILGHLGIKNLIH